MRLNRIVVAVDLSSTPDAYTPTADIVTAAGELASRFGGEVVLVHALGPDAPAAAGSKTLDGEVSCAVGAGNDGGARGRLADEARALARAFPGLTVRSTVESSQRTWLAIIEASERLDADVIVLGAGRHVRDGVLGSTATMVTNISRRHVLVVR